MIGNLIITSLIITGIYVVFSDGMALSPVRVFIANQLDRVLGKKWSTYVQKPLWNCLPCMASVWGIILSWNLNIPFLLALCGINMIISRAIEDEEIVQMEQETEYFDDVPTISRQKVNY